jgi:hypothetical protein
MTKPFDIFAAYATDESKEEDGVVVFLSSGADVATNPWIKVARVGNTAYSKAVSTGYEKLQADKKLLMLSGDEMEIRSKNLMIEVMADTLLKGFGNLSFQGSPQEPTREAKVRLLRVKDFREMVMAKAAEVDLYRVEQSEADAGN